MTTALIADDEPHLARYLRDHLHTQWPELEIVHVARNGVETAERIAALQPDLAFIDTRSTWPMCCSSGPTTNTPACKHARPNT